MSTYKLSRYNHYLNPTAQNGPMVYNAVSNGLAKLDPEVYELLSRGEQGLEAMEGDPSRAQLLASLRKGHVIVEKDLDEIEFMRLKLNLSRFGNLGLSLTIVPTLGCNLACTYCYEGLRGAKFMSDETEDALVAFTKTQVERFGYRSVVVSWFGGEPLMRPKRIYSLSKKLIALCKKAKINYSSMVVTNGTYLNPSMARQLKAHKVSHVQVTIDGPKEIHDARRPFKGGSKSSFDLITRNVESVLGLLPVHVRINVDKTNHQRSLELVDEMRARGWFDEGKQCAFYVGYTRVWTPVCSSIADQCFSMEEFSETELQFQSDLLKRNFSLGNLYPSRSTYCMAAAPGGFVVGPDGELYKCWSDVNNLEACIGNVSTPLELNPKLMEWLNYDPLTQFPKCRECAFFPICAGGCPQVAIQRKNSDGCNCTPWKVLMNQKIDVFLTQLTQQQSKKPVEGGHHGVDH